MFKLAAGGGRSNLPGPALRDATPRQLPPAKAVRGRLSAGFGDSEEF
jgi:hypothetical protein